MLCQQEEREAGRWYPRTCPTCRLGPCQKLDAKPLQSLTDAQAEIARLTAERDEALARAEKAEIDAEFFRSEVKLRNRIESTNDTASDLQRKYEEALARAATAALEMRERAVSVTVDLGPGYDGRPVHYHIPENVKSAIRALPIDPDTQKVLGRMLVKAREDAIGEAAKVAIKQAYYGDHSTAKAILALLNDGGRDE